MIGKNVRTCGRFICFAGVLTAAALRYFFLIWLRGKSASIPARAEWMRACSRRILTALNIEVKRHGVPPAGGLIAANHLGYIDIVVLGSAQPTVFLSKSESLVAGGWLMLEIGLGQRDALAGMLADWDGVEFVHDLQGIPRVAIARRRA